MVQAGGADEALALMGGGSERFDVVLSDRALLVTNGDELALLLEHQYPDHRVITGVGAETQESLPGVDAVRSKLVTGQELREA